LGHGRYAENLPVLFGGLAEQVDHEGTIKRAADV
jgi:hypothetical protein